MQSPWQAWFKRKPLEFVPVVGILCYFTGKRCSLFFCKVEERWRLLHKLQRLQSLHLSLTETTGSSLPVELTSQGSDSEMNVQKRASNFGKVVEKDV
jgi:hypothetical protein